MYKCVFNIIFVLCIVCLYPGEVYPQQKLRSDNLGTENLSEWAVYLEKTATEELTFEGFKLSWNVLRSEAHHRSISMTTGKATFIWDNASEGIAKLILGANKITISNMDNYIRPIHPQDADTVTFCLFINLIGKIDSEGNVTSINNVILEPSKLTANSLEFSSNPQAMFIPIQYYVDGRQAFQDVKNFLKQDGIPPPDGEDPIYNGPVVRNMIKKSMNDWLNLKRLGDRIGESGCGRSQANNGSLGGWGLALCFAFSFVGLNRYLSHKKRV